MIARTGHFEPIVREAFPFVVPLFIICLIAWALDSPWISFFFLCAAVAVALFFRNPERRPPGHEGLLLSPADGTIVDIREDARSEHLSGVPLTRISIFMSIFSVHVNRAPLTGTVRKITHTPGRFLDARDKNSSEENERNSVVFDCDAASIEVIQVAGKIARRIRCWVREGDRIGRGERFGMIRFGSRLDVYVPKEYRITARYGMPVRAGVSVLAELNEDPGPASVLKADI